MNQAKLLVLACLLLPALLFAEDEAIEPHPAGHARLADQALMLDVIAAGQQYVAVGERGYVLVSDSGRDWHQAESVPVRATLTRVAHAEGHLWAVGHDTTIIHSADQGRTWTLQHFRPEWAKPLLDVHFFDADHGLAVGAYGLIMHTEDGGRTWLAEDMADAMTSEAIVWPGSDAEASDQAPPSDDNGLYDAASDFDRGCYEFMECHLNALLVLDDQRILLAAEGGYGFRSADGGQTWESFRFPYAGSMFGLVPAGDGVLAFGLRGHVQLTDSFGSQWRELDSGVQSTLLGGTLGPDGVAVVVGNGATILTYNPDRGQFTVSQDRLGSDYAAVAFARDGSLILAGQDGLKNE